MAFHGRIPGKAPYSNLSIHGTHTTAWDRGRLARNGLAEPPVLPADETSAIPAATLPLRFLRGLRVFAVGVDIKAR